MTMREKWRRPNNEPLLRDKRKTKGSIGDRVEQFYYALGLSCSSHPFVTITFALSISFVCCYPLLSLPLPGNIPRHVQTESNLSTSAKYFIQQIVVRSSVYPWSSLLNISDGFRAPLYEAFKILEIVRNHQHTDQILERLCLHVESAKHSSTLLPQYSCLIVSPTNLWQNNVQSFVTDPNILATIFNHKNFQKGKVSLSELLFGMNLKNTGIKRFPMRNRMRVIQYAFTIVFDKYDASFISSLNKKLRTIYPLHQTTNKRNVTDKSHVIRIYYPNEVVLVELLPLIITLIIFFVYVYFSVKKMESVRSKFVMATSAVITVLLSLSITLSACFFFGMTIELQRHNFFPYLIIVIGLENVLVLTKAVINTAPHLDVKIRVAQGVSREGWLFTKIVLLEITLLTIGFFSLIPTFQEFCVFAITGVLSDLFLQLFFITPILAIDIKRMQVPLDNYAPFNRVRFLNHNRSTKLPQSKSNSNLTTLSLKTPDSDKTTRVPKRLKLVNAWTRARFFQRGFMLWMMVWISMLIYQGYELNLKYYGIVQTRDKTDARPTERNFVKNITLKVHDDFHNEQEYVRGDLIRLRHGAFDPIITNSPLHWSGILNLYNLTVSGYHITLLPTIRISYTVPAEQALSLRNGLEKPIKGFEWSALAAALDPLDVSDDDSMDEVLTYDQFHNMTPYYPNTPLEMVLVCILCVLSLIVLIYIVYVLYKFVCGRDYSERRSSSNEPPVQTHQDVIPAAPKTLDSHSEDIECVAVDGTRVVCSSLASDLYVWDTLSCQLLATINRNNESKSSWTTISQVWCIDYVDNLVAIGCDNGNIELWEGTSGNVKFVYTNVDCHVGVTHVKIVGNRVIVAKLDGFVEFYLLQSYNQGRQIDWSFTSAYRRTHTRTSSDSSINACSNASTEDLRCVRTSKMRVHQQPINVMQCEGDRVITGSQDHTIKIHRNANHVLTLHHFGPITCLRMDEMEACIPMVVSGSYEGVLTMWDGISGACIYRNDAAHAGPVIAVVTSTSYVVTFGVDQRVCVWERFLGHLLHGISVRDAFATSMVMLTECLLVVPKKGKLTVVNVRNGLIVCDISLGVDDSFTFVKQVHMVEETCSVVCDYRNKLKVVTFPFVRNKFE